MKVRIGISLGSAAMPSEFAAAVDELERERVDSLWLPEMVYGPLVDPFIGMAHALSRTARLKVGTGVSVLPGLDPVLVAKQLASPAWRRAGCCRCSACGWLAVASGPCFPCRDPATRCSMSPCGCCGCC